MNGSRPKSNDENVFGFFLRGAELFLAIGRAGSAVFLLALARDDVDVRGARVEEPDVVRVLREPDVACERLPRCKPSTRLMAIPQRLPSGVRTHQVATAVTQSRRRLLCPRWQQSQQRFQQVLLPSVFQHFEQAP